MLQRQCQDAMDLLDKIRKKQKSLDRITFKVLDKAMPLKEVPQRNKKSESEENFD